MKKITNAEAEILLWNDEDLYTQHQLKIINTTKIKIINEAKSIGISVHDWLENICNKELLSRKEKWSG